MILTTTENIAGRSISAYLGLVSAATIAALPGGSKMMMRGMKKQTDEVSALLTSEAESLGADAVVGIKYAALGGNHVLLGTAVKLA